MLKLNAGTLGANFNIFAPPVSKTYIIWNNTSYTATFYNSSVLGNTTAAGSGVVIPAGAKAQIWSDGTNFWSIDSTTGNLTVVGNLSVSGTTSLTTPLPVTSGGTGVSTSTGTGSVVLSISPTLVTPILGTPASGSLVNCTFPTLNQNTTGSAGSIANTGGWAVTPTGTTLYFSYNGTNVAKLDSSGNLTVKANVTAYGTV